MSIKWKFWPRLAAVSVLLGIGLAVLQAYDGISDYTAACFISHSFVLAGVCFVGSVGLVLLLKGAPGFFRWLFTWRILKRCLLVFLFLAALVPLFYAEENWRGHRAWENYKRELESKGEKLDFASYIPALVPDEQNFAFAPVVQTSWNWLLDTNGHKLPEKSTNIIHRLDLSVYRTNQFVSPLPELPEADWRTGTPVDMVACQSYYRVMFVTNRYPVSYPHSMPGEFDSFVTTNYVNPADTNELIEIMALATNEFPTSPQSRSPAADVLLALSKFDGVLGELSAAAKQPQSRFPLNYDADFTSAVLVPHYSELEKCTRVLSLRASVELSGTNPALALADIQLILRLMGSIRNEPFELTQRNRATWFRHAMQPVWEGIAGRRWTDMQLIELDKSLADLDFTADYGFGLQSELAGDIKSIEYMRTQRMKNGFTCICGDTIWWPTLLYRLSPDGWLYLNERTVARVISAAFPTTYEVQHQIISPEISKRSGMAEAWERRPSMIPGNVALSYIPPSDRFAAAAARAQAGLDLARVAIALERHRLAEGAYPESLDALAPRYIGKIPCDVINGQPLHYRRTADGKFLLYSIGWDGVDDGGVIFKTERGRLDEKKGDWVWMFPAN